MLGDPIQPVGCDKCDEVEEFGMTPLAQSSWDNRYLVTRMQRAGWLTVGEQHFCPQCVERMREAA